MPLAGTRDSTELLSAILASLEDDKAEDIVTIPLAGKSEMADHMVIASGRSSRQVAAISEKLADRLKHGLGLNKILGTIHTYPTLAESNKYVAGEWKRAHQPLVLLRWVERLHAWRR